MKIFNPLGQGGLEGNGIYVMFSLEEPLTWVFAQSEKIYQLQPTPVFSLRVCALWQLNVAIEHVPFVYNFPRYKPPVMEDFPIQTSIYRCLPHESTRFNCEKMICRKCYARLHARAVHLGFSFGAEDGGMTMMVYHGLPFFKIILLLFSVFSFKSLINY